MKKGSKWMTRMSIWGRCAENWRRVGKRSDNCQRSSEDLGRRNRHWMQRTRSSRASSCKLSLQWVGRRTHIILETMAPHPTFQSSKHHLLARPRPNSSRTTKKTTFTRNPHNLMAMLVAIMISPETITTTTIRIMQDRAMATKETMPIMTTLMSRQLMILMTFWKKMDSDDHLMLVNNPKKTTVINQAASQKT